jgi:hypothetical protein
MHCLFSNKQKACDKILYFIMDRFSAVIHLSMRDLKRKGNYKIRKMQKKELGEGLY